MRLSTEERQKLIIRTAVEIIHQEGYQNFSIRELANRVGISEPAIYRHFLNKEEIVLGIMNQVSEVHKRLEKEIEKAESAPEKIRDLISKTFSYLEENMEMTSVFFIGDLFGHNKKLREVGTTILAERQAFLQKIIREGQQQESILDLDPRELANLIQGYLSMEMLEWRLRDCSYSLKKKSKGAQELIGRLIFK